MEVYLDEEALIKAFYIEKPLYTVLGRECCLVLDVAFAKGGPEAVV